MYPIASSVEGSVPFEARTFRIRDVAKILSVSERTAAKWLSTGQLPSRLIGRTRLISGADLLKFQQASPAAK